MRSYRITMEHRQRTQMRGRGHRGRRSFHSGSEQLTIELTRIAQYPWQTGWRFFTDPSGIGYHELAKIHLCLPGGFRLEANVGFVRSQGTVQNIRKVFAVILGIEPKIPNIARDRRDLHAGPLLKPESETFAKSCADRRDRHMVPGQSAIRFQRAIMTKMRMPSRNTPSRVPGVQPIGRGNRETRRQNSAELEKPIVIPSEIGPHRPSDRRVGIRQRFSEQPGTRGMQPRFIAHARNLAGKCAEAQCGGQSPYRFIEFEDDSSPQRRASGSHAFNVAVIGRT